ncbi:MAG: glycosyltransferase family 2 protein, partial [Polyangiales bacterium]
MSNAMDLSIVIPTKDRPSILRETLLSALPAARDVSAEVIIVNDSKTAPVSVPEVEGATVRVMDNPKSGVASARNLGARHARAPLLLFIDDDMIISSENLRVTLRLHGELPANSSLNLNWVYPPELQERIRRTHFGRYLMSNGFATLEGWCRGGAWRDDALFRSDGITSQYLSISKAVFESVAGYDETFPHAGFEDYDLAMRLRQAGVDSYIYPLSFVYHDEADRMDPRSWLARKRRGGVTRRVAVERGHSELRHDYGRLRPLFYRTVGAAEP